MICRGMHFWILNSRSPTGREICAGGPESAKFLVNFPVSWEFDVQTGSISAASSTGESVSNAYGIFGAGPATSDKLDNPAAVASSPSTK